MIRDCGVTSEDDFDRRKQTWWLRFSFISRVHIEIIRCIHNRDFISCTIYHQCTELVHVLLRPRYNVSVPPCVPITMFQCRCLCFSVTMCLCYNVSVSPCVDLYYSVSVSPCVPVTVFQFQPMFLLQCFIVTLCLCSIVSVSLCVSVTMFQCHPVSLLQCFSFTMWLLQCFSVAGPYHSISLQSVSG